MAPENEKGEEILDKTPIALPVGYERPEPLEAMVARMVRAASAHSAAMGNETLEEANDFGPDEEDDEVKTPYQYQTMEEEYLDEKPRTSHKGRTAGTDRNAEDSRTDGREVSESGKTSGVESPRNRRIEDKIGNNERRERRQTAGNEADSGSRANKNRV